MLIFGFMALVYQVNKGIGQPVSFKGLKGSYIGLLAIGLVALLLLFTAGYLLGGSLYLLLPGVLVMGSGLVLGLGYLSRRFGLHGLGKYWARRGIPVFLRFSSRRVFTGLRAVRGNHERQVG